MTVLVTLPGFLRRRCTEHRADQADHSHLSPCDKASHFSAGTSERHDTIASYRLNPPIWQSKGFRRCSRLLSNKNVNSHERGRNGRKSNLGLLIQGWIWYIPNNRDRAAYQLSPCRGQRNNCGLRNAVGITNKGFRRVNSALIVTTRNMNNAPSESRKEYDLGVRHSRQTLRVSRRCRGQLPCCYRTLVI
ncbi:hypothetical protein R70199_07586 [Paraburkholderia domus]|nr:hypothetical protein R70199_07586 [Paraburkholderia domus]